MGARKIHVDKPRPRQAAAAAASGDGAWEARTGPSQTQTCRDNPPQRDCVEAVP